MKFVSQVAVIPEEQRLNEVHAKRGKPELQAHVFGAVFAVRVKLTDGNTQDLSAFQDEELANRVARAIVHGTELCGGGDKDPFK